MASHDKVKTVEFGGGQVRDKKRSAARVPSAQLTRSLSSGFNPHERKVAGWRP